MVMWRDIFVTWFCQLAGHHNNFINSYFNENGAIGAVSSMKYIGGKYLTHDLHKGQISELNGPWEMW